MKNRFSLLVFTVLFIFNYGLGSDMLKPGDKAPDFRLKDGTGKWHQLSDYNDQKLVIYFYPKDDTPGCTAEACNIRDNYSELQEAGIQILGVSYDDSSSHTAFTKKYDIPFPLLSDTDKDMAEAYGAKGTLTGWLVAQRITIVIGEGGIVIGVIENVQTGNHVAQIFELIRGKSEE